MPAGSGAPRRTSPRDPSANTHDTARTHRRIDPNFIECDPAAFPDACIWEAASPCPDGQGFNVITIATCTQYAGYGVWHFGTIFEGTECPACDDDPCAVDGLACVTDYEGCENAGTARSGTVCYDDRAMEAWLDVSGCQ